MVSKELKQRLVTLTKKQNLSKKKVQKRKIIKKQKIHRSCAIESTKMYQVFRCNLSNHKIKRVPPKNQIKFPLNMQINKERYSQCS